MSTFLPDRFYLNILNSNEKPVQGAILSKKENIDAQYWYLVTSLNPLSLYVPKLEKSIEIPDGTDPRFFIRMKVNQHLKETGQVKKAKKKSASKKPSKKVNYAAQVVERGY